MSSPRPARSRAGPASPGSEQVKLTFMGTAGARFMVAKQVAASGGLFLEDDDTRISLDPGPGAIVQYAKRKVDLTTLDAIVLSHRHLDHSRRRQRDDRGDDRRRLRTPRPLVLSGGRARRRPSGARVRAAGFREEIVRLEPETSYAVNDLAFTTSAAPRAPGRDLGFRFGDQLGWVTDSALLRRHRRAAQGRRDGDPHRPAMQCRTGLPHLCLDDAERIIRDAKPRLAFLTHYGMTVWRAHPREVAADLTQRTGIEVKAARRRNVARAWMSRTVAMARLGRAPRRLPCVLHLPAAARTSDVINSDWPAFATGARLIVSDPGHLYDFDVQQRVELEVTGGRVLVTLGIHGILPFLAPAWVALLAVPFERSGTEIGGRLWILFGLVCLAPASTSRPGPGPRPRSFPAFAVRADRTRAAQRPARRHRRPRTRRPRSLCGRGRTWPGSRLGLTLVKPQLVLPLGAAALARAKVEGAGGLGRVRPRAGGRHSAV